MTSDWLPPHEAHQKLLAGQAEQTALLRQSRDLLQAIHDNHLAECIRRRSEGPPAQEPAVTEAERPKRQGRSKR